MTKRIAAALLSASILSLAAPITASEAVAATYVASFDGMFDDGNAFSGKIRYDTDLITGLHNHAVLGYSISSQSYFKYFGKSNISDADFPNPSEYVLTTSTKSNGNSADYDTLGFSLQPFPYGLQSVTLGFWVYYDLGSLGTTITSTPSSNKIVKSAAGYVGFFYNPPTQPGEMVNVSGSINNFSVAPAANSAVPEPATWGLMIAGVGMAGATLRRRRKTVVALKFT